MSGRAKAGKKAATRIGTHIVQRLETWFRLGGFGGTAASGLSFGAAPGLSFGAPAPNGSLNPAGGCGGSGLAPPMPAVGDAIAGTEPERSGGGVRLMLNWVNQRDRGSC